MKLKIETINICSARCTFCDISAMTRPRKIMSAALFQSVIEQYNDMLGGDLALCPVVGDSLLDPYLPSRLMFCRLYPNIGEISVTTNLMPLDRIANEIIVGMLRLVDVWNCIIPANSHISSSIMRANFPLILKELERLIKLAGADTHCAFNVIGVGSAEKFEIDERILTLTTKLLGRPAEWLTACTSWKNSVKDQIYPVVYCDGLVGLHGYTDFDAKDAIGDVTVDTLSKLLSGIGDDHAVSKDCIG